MKPNQVAQVASLNMWLKGLGSGLLILVLFLCIITMFCGLMELKVVKNLIFYDLVDLNKDTVLYQSALHSKM